MWRGGGCLCLGGCLVVCVCVCESLLGFICVCVCVLRFVYVCLCVFLCYFFARVYACLQFTRNFVTCVLDV